MAELLVLGAGVVGLGTALLLAKDGHHVTILERDPQPPPEFAIAAWETWERRGVNQFRLPHFFLARWRTILDGELPHVTEAIQAAGGLRYNPLLALPEAVRGPARTEDAQLEVLTGRRPLVECALAEAAAGHPAIKVCRGVAASAVLSGKATRAGVLHVRGVRTENGEELTADLVVDLTGRRSQLARWLIEAGGRPPREVCEDSGFTYYRAPLPLARRDDPSDVRSRLPTVGDDWQCDARRRQRHLVRGAGRRRPRPGPVRFAGCIAVGARRAVPAPGRSLVGRRAGR